MDLHLSGKIAVVTGASKGIGLAVTRALAAEGVSVVAGAREVIGELAQLAVDFPVRPVRVDLSTPDGPARLVEEAVSAFGDLDILVNNVGAVRPRLDGFLSITDDEWIETLTINFLSAVRTTRAALPHLLDRGAGAVVTVSSVNASLPDPLVLDYSAAKGRWPTSPRGCPRRSVPAEYASTRSVPGLSPPPFGSVTTVSPRPSRASWAVIRRPSPRRPSAPRRPGGSPPRRRSPTSSCSWPATVRRTSPAPTSPSTAV